MIKSAAGCSRHFGFEHTLNTASRETANDIIKHSGSPLLPLRESACYVSMIGMTVFDWVNKVWVMGRMGAELKGDLFLLNI